MTDTDKLVTIERLRDLLAAYGARPGKWPSDERAAAQALIETSAEARELFEEEQALDALLQKVAEPQVSAALQSRVLSISPSAAPLADRRGLAVILDWLRPQSQMAWQGAVAAACVIGIVIGVGISPHILGTKAETVTIVENAGTPTPQAQQARPFSLTGEVVNASGADDTETAENTENEFTVAGIPLY